MQFRLRSVPCAVTLRSDPFDLDVRTRADDRYRTSGEILPEPIIANATLCATTYEFRETLVSP